MAKVIAVLRKFSVGLAISVALLAPMAFTPAVEAGCIAKFIEMLDDCSYLPTAWERSVCGADAYIEFVHCLMGIHD